MTTTSSSVDATALTTLTSEIVASYLLNHQVAVSDLAVLIDSVHQTLSTLDEPVVVFADTPTTATPAQIRKSVTPDAITSFEDGKPYKTLKRHLRTCGLTFAEYRAKWGLPSDYPATAASYSARRSELAKVLGLGRKPAAEPVAPVALVKAGRRKTAVAD